MRCCEINRSNGFVSFSELPNRLVCNIRIKQCKHCGVEDIRVGWQSDALVTFKRNGLLGNRIKFLTCGNCGAVLYQCVAEPHRFPQAR